MATRKRPPPECRTRCNSLINGDRHLGIVPAITPSLFKGLKITLGDTGPNHFTAHGICGSADLFHTLGIIKQTAHLIRNGMRILKRDKDPPSTFTKLLGMPVRRRNHGLSRSDDIGEGS